MYNINEKEKEMLFDIIKRIPGYDTFMIDRNGNDLFVGDQVKIFTFNNENYLIGKIVYNNKVKDFCIEIQDGSARYSSDWYNVNYLYFVKIKIDDIVQPYIIRDRIEKDKNHKTPKFEKPYYTLLIDNGKYKELYEELIKLTDKNIIKLSMVEMSLFNKILKNDKFKFEIDLALDIKSFGDIKNENVFDFIRKNLKFIKEKIELDIDKIYKINKFYYDGEFCINNITICWSYNVLKDRSSILTIELTENN